MTNDTLLHRQVNPGWVQQGRITSQVFRPTPKDGKKLSVYDGDMITPEKAWNHFTKELGCTSVGVMAVRVGECSARQLKVLEDRKPYPEHIVVDFASMSEGQIRTAAKYLKAAAESHGWQYRHEAE